MGKLDEFKKLAGADFNFKFVESLGNVIGTILKDIKKGDKDLSDVQKRMDSLGKVISGLPDVGKAMKNGLTFTATDFVDSSKYKEYITNFEQSVHGLTEKARQTLATEKNKLDKELDKVLNGNADVTVRSPISGEVIKSIEAIKGMDLKKAHRILKEIRDSLVLSPDELALNKSTKGKIETYFKKEQARLQEEAKKNIQAIYDEKLFSTYQNIFSNPANLTFASASKELSELINALDATRKEYNSTKQAVSELEKAEGIESERTKEATIALKNKREELKALENQLKDATATTRLFNNELSSTPATKNNNALQTQTPAHETVIAGQVVANNVVNAETKGKQSQGTTLDTKELDKLNESIQKINPNLVTMNEGLSKADVGIVALTSNVEKLATATNSIKLTGEQLSVDKNIFTPIMDTIKGVITKATITSVNATDNISKADSNSTNAFSRLNKKVDNLNSRIDRTISSLGSLLDNVKEVQKTYEKTYKSNNFVPIEEHAKQILTKIDEQSNNVFTGMTVFTNKVVKGMQEVNKAFKEFSTNSIDSEGKTVKSTVNEIKDSLSQLGKAANTAGNKVIPFAQSMERLNEAFTGNTISSSSSAIEKMVIALGNLSTPLSTSVNKLSEAVNNVDKLSNAVSKPQEHNVQISLPSTELNSFTGAVLKATEALRSMTSVIVGGGSTSNNPAPTHSPEELRGIYSKIYSELTKEQRSQARRELFGDARKGSQYDVGKYWYNKRNEVQTHNLSNKKFNGEVSKVPFDFDLQLLANKTKRRNTHNHINNKDFGSANDFLLSAKGSSTSIPKTLTEQKAILQKYLDLAMQGDKDVVVRDLGGKAKFTGDDAYNWIVEQYRKVVNALSKVKEEISNVDKDTDTNRNRVLDNFKALLQDYKEAKEYYKAIGQLMPPTKQHSFYNKAKNIMEEANEAGLNTTRWNLDSKFDGNPAQYANYIKEEIKLQKELDKLQTTYYNNRNMNEKAYADLLKQQKQILSRSKNPSALTPRLTDTQADRDKARLNTYKQAYDQIISKQQEMLRTGEYLNSRTAEKLTKEANAYAKAYNELANLMRGNGMQVDHLKTTPFEAYSANGGYYTVDYYNENAARANANKARENQKDYFERMLNGANYYSGSGITSYSDELSKVKALQEGNLMSWFQTGNKQSMQSFMNMTANVTKLTNEYERLNRVLGTTSTTWDTLTKKMAHHLTWMTSGMFVGAPFMAVQQTFDTLKEIEFAMAGIQQVMPSIETDMAAAKQEARDLIGIASRYGESVGGVMESAKSIGRMYGKDIDEKGNKVAGVGATNTNIMTAQAAKMAVADAFSMEEAFRGLESAMAQWNLQTENSNELMVRTNRLLETWTITAHNGAASGRDIANAIEVAGTAAAQAGMSFEFFNALLATGVRQTARSGSEIGTAIKSMTVSLESDKARKQLEAWGIEYLEKDKEGNERVRNIEDLILDISAKVSTTDKDTHALLTALSGGRRILAAYHGNMVS